MPKHDRSFRKVEPEPDDEQEPVLTPSLEETPAEEGTIPEYVLTVDDDAPPVVETVEATPVPPVRYAIHATEMELARWEARRVELKKTPPASLGDGEYAEVKGRIAALHDQLAAAGKGQGL